MQAVVELAGLVKRYRGRDVLAGVEWRLERGAVQHLRGAEGAGKTTLTRVVLGLVPADAGLALVLGHDARRLPAVARRRLALSPAEPWLPPRARVERVLAEAARREPGWDPALAARGAAWLELDGARRCGELAPFERRRLELHLALALRPELVVLDELGRGLAPAELAALLGRCDAAAAEAGASFLWTGPDAPPAGRASALLERGLVRREVAA